MRNRIAVSCCALAMAAVLPSSVCCAAEKPVPDWVYTTLESMAADGYVTLPEGGLDSLSREELAQLAAQALKSMDHHVGEPGPSGADAGAMGTEYGNLLRLSVADEAQCQLLEEQVRSLNREYKSAHADLKRDMVLLSRQSGREMKASKIQAMEIQQKLDASRLEVVANQRTVARAKLRHRMALAEQSKARLEAMEQTVIDGGEAADVSEAAESASNDNSAYTAPYEEAGEVLPIPNASTDGMRSVSADDAGRLRAEFSGELGSMGYFDDENAQQQAVIERKPDHTQTPRLHLDGEVRLDHGMNSGSKLVDDRTRLRLRLFPDYNIDGNWHAKGMIESEKVIRGSGSEGKTSFDRYYLEGRSGITFLDIGAFGDMMAEGNIYDSKFTGIRAQVGKPVRYTFEMGKINSVHRASDIVASYDTSSYGVDAGYYHFDSLAGSSARSIYMLNYRKPLGKFNFGAMFLHGVDKRVGDGNGYVLTLSHGKEDTWKRGSLMLYGKYYRQPASTYVEHTMNGMADYMAGGFKGFGFGMSYTPKKDWLWTVEYDRLQDLKSNERNHTFWTSLTYFFKNYEDD